MGQCQFDFTPLFEDKHKKEVVAMAVSEDLLVSVSKDQDLVTWSTRSKVPPPGRELLPPPSCAGVPVPAAAGRPRPQREPGLPPHPGRARHGRHHGLPQPGPGGPGAAAGNWGQHTALALPPYVEC